MSETDRQPYNNQPILYVKFKEDMRKFVALTLKKEGRHLENWCFELEWANSWIEYTKSKQIMGGK